MKQVTDPQLLAQLEGDGGKKVTDPQLLAQLEGRPDWKGLISQSVKDVFQRPAAFAKDLGTNPETMADAMPTLMGTAGGVSPIVGGATMGTAAGQGIRDLALKGLNKPVPSSAQHIVELGGAALGDVAAIPGLKRNYYGGQIGRAEKAAGLVTRAPEKAVTPGSVGKTLNELEARFDQDAAYRKMFGSGTMSPQEARDAKAVVNQVYKNPKIYEQTSDISVQAQRVSRKAQDLLNRMVPGRQAPSQAMGKAMAIPNFMRKTYQAVPWKVKLGLEGALGLGGAAEILKVLYGGK